MTAAVFLGRTVPNRLVERMRKPCRIWTGATSKGGYPKANIRGRYVGLHRLVLEHRLGRRLGADEFACHRCDVPACMEPTHLYAGSALANQRDRRRRGTAVPGLCQMTLRKADVRRMFL